MTTEAFKAHLHARPFHTVTVHLDNGRPLPALTPKGWEVGIWTGDHPSDSVDLNAVSCLEVNRGRASGGRTFSTIARAVP